jgi:hypothetical protein
MLWDWDPADSPSSLTRRLLDEARNPDVVWAVDPHPALVTATANQLLVRRSHLRSAELVHELRELNAVRVGSMLEGLSLSDEEREEFDVDLFRLDGNAFEAVEHLHERVLIDALPPQVSPHHVLVPSNWAHCPAGPPTATNAPVFIDPFDPTESVDVVVIDSGYIEHPVLHARGGVASTRGQYLASNGRWTPEPRDGLDLSPTDGLVDAIAGHGTFIAGVVATGCARANMTIVGHRHIDLTATTELAVARSIFAHASVGTTGTRGSGLVISCGYAFATQGCVPSVAFEAALSYLATVNPGAVLVAPAGNEAVDAPQWPAAFRSVGYSNVVGVGSLSRCGTKIASFSNRGDWVDCFAIGEDVVSTHITTARPMAAEERPETRQLFTGWSEWSGTSFAAPKVAAAIAAAVRPGVSPRDAADALLEYAPRMADGGSNAGTAANLAELG